MCPTRDCGKCPRPPYDDLGETPWERKARLKAAAREAAKASKAKAKAAAKAKAKADKKAAKRGSSPPRQATPIMAEHEQWKIMTAGQQRSAARKLPPAQKEQAQKGRLRGYVRVDSRGKETIVWSETRPW